MSILVTGAAGFIGFHTAKALLERGADVVGLDDLNTYYDVALKEARLAELQKDARFRFRKVDLADRAATEAVFDAERFERVIHLAAQAGVRYSLTHPQAYIDANITGFLNILECCRTREIEHLVYASSSSVYGANAAQPFSEEQGVDHPVSLYAASKRSNELMAHVYASLYGLPVTGLRFFTVYGPWGRPDMAPYKFTEKIFAGTPIDIYNNGAHKRDFTYVDDVVEAMLRVADHPATPDPDWDAQAPRPDRSYAPYRVFNIGCGRPVQLMDFVACLEQAVGREAQKIFLEKQPGDVDETFADVTSLHALTGFTPQVPLEEGVVRFVRWYRDYTS